MDNGINQTIASEIMKTDKYDMLMKGNVVRLDINELHDYISCQNELDINTIKIQTGSFGYSVRTDKPTIIKYLEKKGNKLMVCGETNPIKRYEQMLKKGV